CELLELADEQQVVGGLGGFGYAVEYRCTDAVGNNRDAIRRETPAAREEIAFGVGERNYGVGLAQHEAVRQASSPAHGQPVHGKWIVCGEDERWPVGGCCQ